MKFIQEFQLSIIRFLMLIIASLTVIQPIGQCTRLARSGIYYDNGEDQTVAHQFTSRRQRRAFTKDISKLLDLPIKPSRNRTLQMNVPASRFIRDVYRRASAQQVVGSLEFNDTELKIIEDSDIILSYPALTRLENQTKNTLKFDLTETPEFSDAFRAELRVYVKPLINSTWTISLFDSQNFVDSTNVTNECWIKLNATKTLRRWLSCNDCVHELHLTTFSLDNDVISNNEILLLDELQKQAFLVGYFKNTHRDTIQPTVPNIRSDRNVKSSRNYLDNPYSVVSKETNRRRKSSCAMYSLHLRFHELGFDESIVEPEGYDARYCRGDCRFPLTAHMNATNHALVQTLVHFLRPRLVPRVSCAPRDYEDLPVFTRNGDTFVYKIKRQRIVKSCGCC